MTYLNTCPASLGRKDVFVGICVLGSILCIFTQGMLGFPSDSVVCCTVIALVAASGFYYWQGLCCANVGTIIGNTSACHKQAWKVESTGLTGMCP